MKELDFLTETIIGCCYKVHSTLGPGFNEKIYQKALKLVLEEAKLQCATEKSYKVVFHGQKVGALRLDLVVNDMVVVEVKAISGKMPEVFQHQVLSYLKVSGLHVGLLINFGNKSCQVRRLMV